MSKLSKERLEEIKAIRQLDKDACHWGHVGDLLLHIAALESELVEANKTIARLISDVACLSKTLRQTRWF